MQINTLLVCPEHQTSLELVNQDSFVCPYACKFHVINKILRFVSSVNYASSFGYQWNIFRQTQLDSYTGLDISEKRLLRLAGGSLDLFNGKTILEAGCGAGRFTEILLKNKAKVFACDLSNAIEANYTNCKKFDDYFACQADILNLPVKPESFDIVVCIGVVQHTPDPEKTINKLISYLKPGGLLIFDHYTYGYPASFSRRACRYFLLKLPVRPRYVLVKIMTIFLWPIHLVLFRYKRFKIFNKVRNAFIKLSPIVDYQDAYPQLSSELLFQWAFLDTHDTLTDQFKHLRSVEEIQQTLESNGIKKYEVYYAGNGVEARAFKSADKSTEERNY